MERRRFMQCLAWAGTGLVWAARGGVLSATTLGEAAAAGADFTFAQISDTHVGFGGEANKDAPGTLRDSIAAINALEPRPSFVLHTGDLSHGQKPGAFDTLAESLKAVKAEKIFFIPGEHDVAIDGGKEYLGRYGAGTSEGRGFQSFDYRGVHFVGLVNVLSYKPGVGGALGDEQLAWLRRDLDAQTPSTPIVVFSHVPLWAVYPAWGWTTADGEQAIGMLRRFGSVTALNGHIHQVLQKVEGNITFHSARSTAFPQPAPGAAPAPGPMKVEAEQLRRLLGVRQVRYTEGSGPLAVVERPLA
jgi:3',5'-cyclic AMP phosphodiesterase CpdA